MIPTIGAAAVRGQFAMGSRASIAGAWTPTPRVSFRSLLQRHPADPRSTPPYRISEQPAIEGPRHRPTPPARIDDALDPLHRRRAALAPPDACSIYSHASSQSLSASSTCAAATPSAATASLEELVPALVRRIAWAGDRHRGVVRLELGAGDLAGTTLVVHADAGSVRVNMITPPGVDTAAWQRRISRRLASRGIPIESVEVT
jgi:hypothetical protein